MALTGAVLAGRCFPSQSDAVDSYYSGSASAQLPGSTSYVNQFVKEYGVWKIKAYEISSGGSWSLRFTSDAPTPLFPACDPTEKFFDGMSLGWGVATALVLVASITMMKRGMLHG